LLLAEYLSNKLLDSTALDARVSCFTMSWLGLC